MTVVNGRLTWLPSIESRESEMKNTGDQLCGWGTLGHALCPLLERFHSETASLQNNWARNASIKPRYCSVIAMIFPLQRFLADCDTIKYQGTMCNTKVVQKFSSGGIYDSRSTNLAKRSLKMYFGSFSRSWGRSQLYVTAWTKGCLHNIRSLLNVFISNSLLIVNTCTKYMYRHVQ